MKPTKRRLGRPLDTQAPDPRGILEALFLQAYPFARRAAQVRSVSAVSRRTNFDRQDLEQEALVAIWAALVQFDALRASLRTFVERVVATTSASIFRRAAAKKRTKPGDYHAPAETLQLVLRVEYRVDLQRVLGKLGHRERKVASLLVEYGPAQIARRLRISRPAVYRIISRIRAALEEGGYGR